MSEAVELIVNSSSNLPEFILLAVIVGFGAWFYKMYSERRARKYQLTIMDYTIDSNGSNVEDNWGTCISFLRLVEDPELLLTTRYIPPKTKEE